MYSLGQFPLRCGDFRVRAAVLDTTIAFTKTYGIPSVRADLVSTSWGLFRWEEGFSDTTAEYSAEPRHKEPIKVPQQRKEEVAEVAGPNPQRIGHEGPTDHVPEEV